MLTRRTPLQRTPMKRTAVRFTQTANAKSKVRVTGPTRDVVEAVLERDQHSCVVCGKNLHGTRGRDFSLHHRRPRRMGGDRRPDTNLPANLVCVCGSGTEGCHGWLESRRSEAMEMGLILHADDKPTEHPIATWYGSVWLDNAGHLWPVGGERP